MATTIDRVKEICKQITAEDVSEQTLLPDLNLDSLDMVELITELEEEFEVQIPDEKAEEFKTVQEIVTFIDGAEKRRWGV